MTAEPHRFAALREPFPPDRIGRLPKGGTWLDYVGHADVTDRLLTVDPAWTWEPLALDARGLPALDEHGGLWIRLTVLGVTRLGYGDAGGKKGPNAVKECIGDALRNAAMRFGVALDLWAKGDRQYGVGHDTADHAPQPVPPHAQAALDVVLALAPDDQEALREWVGVQGYGHPRAWTPEQAEAVTAQARRQAAK